MIEGQHMLRSANTGAGSLAKERMELGKVYVGQHLDGGMVGHLFEETLAVFYFVMPIKL